MTTTPHVETSLVEVTDTIKKVTGRTKSCRIFVKNEYEQPSGSFKLRGMGNLIRKRLEEAKSLGKTKVKVFSSSGGNAGLAATYAARSNGLECVVVLPQVTSKQAIRLLKEFGAEVIVKGTHWGEADKFLREELIQQLDESFYPIYCHPFNDEDLWDGHATIMDEVFQQLSDEDSRNLKAVVCSVGGGGLYNGVVRGIERSTDSALREIPVVAVETKQAPTFHAAIEAGKVVVLESVNTLATSLASPYISTQSLIYYKSHPTSPLLIDDNDSLRGTIDFYDNFSKLTEPACGATMSLAFSKYDLLAQQIDLHPNDIVVFVACGGKSTDLEKLQSYRQILAEDSA